MPTRGIFRWGCPRLGLCATRRPMPPASRTLRRVITDNHSIDGRKSGNRTPAAELSANNGRCQVPPNVQANRRAAPMLAKLKPRAGPSG